MNINLLKGTKYFEHINRNIAKINIPTFRALIAVFLERVLEL